MASVMFSKVTLSQRLSRLWRPTVRREACSLLSNGTNEYLPSIHYEDEISDGYELKYGLLREADCKARNRDAAVSAKLNPQKG